MTEIERYGSIESDIAMKNIVMAEEIQSAWIRRNRIKVLKVWMAGCSGQKGAA